LPGQDDDRKPGYQYNERGNREKESYRQCNGRIYHSYIAGPAVKQNDTPPILHPAKNQQSTR